MEEFVKTEHLSLNWVNVPQGSVAGFLLFLIFISDFTGQLTVHELGEVARCSLQAIELLELSLSHSNNCADQTSPPRNRLSAILPAAFFLIFLCM